MRTLVIVIALGLALYLVSCRGEKKEGMTPEQEPPETTEKENLRQPVNAGKFYPADSKELQAMVEGFLSGAKTEPLDNVIAITVPHAGYVYSGKTAGYAFKSASEMKPDTIILIGPYHYAPLSGASVFTSGKFLSPLGESPIDEELAQLFIEKVEGAYDNPAPHYQEHSLENQLPFIHYIWGNIPIVPIILNQGDKDFAEELGEGLASVIQESGKNILIVSTVDMSHYHPIDIAEQLDQSALSAINTDDPLYIVDTNEQGISEVDAPLVLGAVNYAAQELDAGKPQILHYSTSADFSGDESSVVGYSAIVWNKEE